MIWWEAIRTTVRSEYENSRILAKADTEGTEVDVYLDGK